MTAEADGTFTGTVLAKTSFSSCAHQVGQKVWTGMTLQPDGSYWGRHQWLTGFPACQPIPNLGLAAWRVLEDASGSTYMIFCTNEPGVRTQPTIGPGGETGGTHNCITSGLIPQTQIDSGPSGLTASSSAAFTFSSSEPGTFECRLDSSDPSAWAPCSSPQSYSSLADGSHSFEVRAVEDGVADPTPASASFVVDTQPPQTLIDSGPTGPTASTSAVFAFSSSEHGTFASSELGSLSPSKHVSFQCRLDSSSPSAWAACTSPKSYSSLAEGSHGFEVRAVDAAGNADPTPASASFVVDTGPPPPVAGESVDVEPAEGTVELQCPGESEFSRLTSFKQIPLGCLINTRNGTVDLTASKGENVGLQNGYFWGGVFVVSQEQGENQEVDLKLAGRRMCERRRTRNGRVAEVSRKGGGGRKLWGSGKGNFKTTGNYGSATVRGTTWLVVDRCDDSTLIKVGEGTVWVRDFVKSKSLVLTTGQEYLAKARIPRLRGG